MTNFEVNTERSQEDKMENKKKFSMESVEEMNPNTVEKPKEGIFQKFHDFIKKALKKIDDYTPSVVKSVIKSKIIRLVFKAAPVKWVGRVLKNVFVGMFFALGPIAKLSWWTELSREFVNISARKTFETFAMVLKHSLYKDGGNKLEKEILEERAKYQPTSAFMTHKAAPVTTNEGYGRNTVFGGNGNSPTNYSSDKTPFEGW